MPQRPGPGVRASWERVRVRKVRSEETVANRKGRPNVSYTGYASIYRVLEQQQGESIDTLNEFGKGHIEYLCKRKSLPRFNTERSSMATKQPMLHLHFKLQTREHLHQDSVKLFSHFTAVLNESAGAQLREQHKNH